MNKRDKLLILIGKLQALKMIDADIFEITDIVLSKDLIISRIIDVENKLKKIIK